MKLTNDKEKVSYIIGEDIGFSFQREGYDLDIDIMLEAIKGAATGKSENLLSETEKNEVMMRWQQEMQAKKQAQMAEQAKAAKKDGMAFLAQNRNNLGVFETPSGLQYQVIKGAEGRKPAATDTVHVHYHGTLLNGQVFDSSVQRGEPISFPLNQVIAGWTEGLQLMSIGSKYKFFIPSELAYGDQAVGTIPAGSTLIFEVELLDIK
ncbi:MAG: FKBP-type peptidyl-prolyl cis-trans isomerase [Bacteroidales bacterium]|nr:FKBP-type peptidyl-prolyl cis-trans isomerase [Bacteroidales bacterium]MBQ2303534.1 FKBP-type peptidyl-prolyl cis-trans isomerase [Bacteroidales bacterium]